MAARKQAKTNGEAAKAAEPRDEPAAAEPAVTAPAPAVEPVAAGPGDTEIKAMIAETAADAGIAVLMPRIGKDGAPAMKGKTAVYDAAERAPVGDDILAFKVTDTEARFVTADGRKHRIAR